MRGIGLAVCLQVGVCMSGVAQDLQLNKVMNLSVSNKGITRISVEGDPIREMFLYPDNLQEHVTLHKSGHLFIAGQNIDKELSVTLITSKGEIQDLTIQSVSKPSGPIILKSIQKKKEISNKTIQGWLEDIGRKYIPAGFQSVGLTETDRFTDQYVAKASESYTNETHLITTFELTNNSSQNTQIEAQKFIRPGEGVYLLKSTLEPNEATRVIIIKKKGNDL